MKLLADHGADPKMTTKAGHHAADGGRRPRLLGRREPGPVHRRAPKPSGSRPSSSRSTLGNDVNAHADFGDYPMTGDTAYTLLYYPHNIDDLLELGVGDPRWSGSTPLHRRGRVRPAVDRPVPRRSRRARRRQDEAWMDAAARRRRCVLREREKGISAGRGDSAESAQLRAGARRPALC